MAYRRVIFEAEVSRRLEGCEVDAVERKLERGRAGRAWSRFGSGLGLGLGLGHRLGLGLGLRLGLRQDRRSAYAAVRRRLLVAARVGAHVAAPGRSHVAHQRPLVRRPHVALRGCNHKQSLRDVPWNCMVRIACARTLQVDQALNTQASSQKQPGKSSFVGERVHLHGRRSRQSTRPARMLD